MHTVVLAWLRAERDGYLAQVQPQSGLVPSVVAALLDNSDSNNAEENRMRLRLLYRARNLFVLEIPPDTKWFDVRNLKHEHLGELYAVNHASWTDQSDRNELHKVAARKGKVMQKLPSQWEPPILWGHTCSGPFTILEGNNRLTAYAASGQADLNVPAFVGLSPLKCLWHAPDQVGPLIRDMLGG